MTERLAPVRRSHWQVLLLLGVISLIAITPLLRWGASCGHDFDFHLVSWMEALRSWHDGILYPHWTTSPNYGAGEARFVFYPPLTWMLGGALGAVLPWSWTAQAFTFLALWACGTSLYFFAKEWLTREAAALASCLYIASPYTLFNAYERTAYGELLAGVWLPLIVLFALRRKNSWIWLALTLAGIWLTNAPGAVMGEYLLAGVVITAAIQERSLTPVIRAGSAQILGLGLASIYVLPAAYEQRWVSITEAIGPGMRVQDSWLFEHTGQAFHDQVLHTASWLAVILLGVAVTAALLAWKKEEREDRRWLLPLMLAVPIIFFLLLSPSEFLWQHLPKLRFLQFPWRWLVVASLSATVLLACAGKNLVQGKFRRFVLPALPLLTAVLVFAAFKTFHFYQSCDEEDAVSAQVELFKNGTGIEGTDEYSPLGADNTAIQQGLPAVRILEDAYDDAAQGDTPNPEWSREESGTMKSAVKVLRWQPEHKQIVIRSAEEGYAVLRLREYPAWQVRRNGKEVLSRPQRPDGLMVVPVGIGSNEITIIWKATPDVLEARIITGLAILGLLGAALRNRKGARQVS